jgi:hypothetical protein
MRTHHNVMFTGITRFGTTDIQTNVVTHLEVMSGSGVMGGRRDTVFVGYQVTMKGEVIIGTGSQADL